MSSQGIQGHDSIPKQIAERYALLFQKYLPGWSVDGAYNFDARPSSQIASAQTTSAMHSGSHPWINDRLDELMRQLTANGPDGPAGLAA